MLNEQLGINSFPTAAAQSAGAGRRTATFWFASYDTNHCATSHLNDYQTAWRLALVSVWWVYLTKLMNSTAISVSGRWWSVTGRHQLRSAKQMTTGQSGSPWHLPGPIIWPQRSRQSSPAHSDSRAIIGPPCLHCMQLRTVLHNKKIALNILLSLLYLYIISSNIVKKNFIMDKANALATKINQIISLAIIKRRRPGQTSSRAVRQ